VIQKDIIDDAVYDALELPAIHFIESVPHIRAALVSIDQTAQGARYGTLEIFTSIQNALVHANRTLDGIIFGAHCVIFLSIVTTYFTINARRRSLSEFAKKSGAEPSTDGSRETIDG